MPSDTSFRCAVLVNESSAKIVTVSRYDEARETTSYHIFLAEALRCFCFEGIVTVILSDGGSVALSAWLF